VKGWTVESIPQPPENKVAIEWFESKLNQGILELNDHFTKYRMSDALMTVYKLIWDDFCAWYLEIVKPEFGEPIDQATYDKTVAFFETVLKLLHPFMPFITEELWGELNQRNERERIIIAPWPRATKIDNQILEEGNYAFQLITEVRNTRNSKGLSPKEALILNVKEEKPLITAFWPVVKKLSNLKELTPTREKVSGAVGIVIKLSEFFIPMEGKLDAAKEKESILKELEYQKGFLASVNKKLDNERFVSGAPAQVIEIERKKKADAEMKIAALEERLKSL
jgi:valyl-tRNA synthetase